MANKHTREDEDVFKTTDRYNRFNELGEEILNPTPMQPPVGYKKQPSMIDIVRQQVAAHHASLLDMEPETEDEADDFDIPDDPVDPQSRWENDNVPSLKNIKDRRIAMEAELAQLEAAEPPLPPKLNPEPSKNEPSI